MDGQWLGLTLETSARLMTGPQGGGRWGQQGTDLGFLPGLVESEYGIAAVTQGPLGRVHSGLSLVGKEAFPANPPLAAVAGTHNAMLCSLEAGGGCGHLFRRTTFWGPSLAHHCSCK